jgi:hypothetical protein
MRYLRELAVDAHLMMFNNEISHFYPENDTWRIEKWRDFIHVLDIRNDPDDVFLKRRKFVKDQLRGYDIYIGCGYTPAYFYKTKMNLDIFVPYSGDVEGTRSIKLFDFLRHPKGAFLQYYSKLLQVKGIKGSKKILTMSFTAILKKKLEEMKVKHEIVSVPMVYNLENLNIPKITHNRKLNEIQKVIKSSDMVIFSQSRQIWKTLYTEIHRMVGGKKNHLLIIGFAEYLKQSTLKKPLLVLVEYGIDVENSKTLIRDLRIENNVLWVPLMPRKEIMLLLNYADFGADQFGGGFWGGSGWEILSQGKPLFNYLSVSDEEYKKFTGHYPPPILNVRTSEEIRDHLLNFENNKDYYMDIGKQSQEWFNKYNGIGLAKKYKYIIECLYNGIEVDPDILYGE